ncbi:MAG: VanZ family protein [Lachnospiraceae bacterium]|nr:VanZ family protein [Lachnospiraceae bacterium]
MKEIKHKGRYISRILLLIYLLLLIRLIIFKYPIPVLRGIMDEWELSNAKAGVATANLTLFKTIRMYIRYYDRLNGFDNLFGNILAFMPLGVLIPLAFHGMDRWWMVLLHSFWLSLCIELFQLVSHFGAFDVDDILLNTMGGILGFCLFLLVRTIYRKRRSS